jgi:hypothetical protein
LQSKVYKAAKSGDKPNNTEGRDETKQRDKKRRPTQHHQPKMQSKELAEPEERTKENSQQHQLELAHRRKQTELPTNIREASEAYVCSGKALLKMIIASLKCSFFPRACLNMYFIKKK